LEDVSALQIFSALSLSNILEDERDSPIPPQTCYLQHVPPLYQPRVISIL
jgi:hypothetical protein